MKSTLRLLVDDSQIVLPVGSVGFALAGQDTSNWKPLISMRESDMRHQALYRNVPLRRSGSAACLIVAVLLFCPVFAAQEGPPQEPGPFRKTELVEIISLDPTIHLDIRYATPNNLVGRAVYREARAFLQKPAAEALVRVHRSLKPRGYGLLIFDGYRPWSVTKVFWEITPPEKHGFVANPAEGSKHNRGCAVDLS